MWAACVAIGVGQVGCSKSEYTTAGDERSRSDLAVRFTDLQAEVETLVTRFDFDEAEARLWAFEDELRAAGLELDPLHDRLKKQLDEVHDQQREHQQLLSGGSVVFEGRVVSPTERNAILARRAEAQEQRAAEAQQEVADRNRAEEDARATAQAIDKAKRMGAQAKVDAYVLESKRRHRAMLAELQNKINAFIAAGPAEHLRKELAQRQRTGPEPVVLGSKYSDTIWDFQFGRIGTLGDARVVEILDNWTALVNVSGTLVFVTRFGTLSQAVGKPLRPPVGIMEVVGVRADESGGGSQPPSGAAKRLYVLGPFNIGPFASELPASMLGQ